MLFPDAMNGHFVTRSLFYSLFAAIAVEAGFCALMGGGGGVPLADVYVDPGFWIAHAIFAGLVAIRMHRKLGEEAPSRGAVTAVVAIGPLLASGVVVAALFLYARSRGLLEGAVTQDVVARGTLLGLLNGLGYPIGAAVAGAFFPSPEIRTTPSGNPDSPT